MDAPSGNLQGDDNELVTPRVNSGLNLEGGKDDIEAQIHLLEQEAYCSVLRAFKAQADSISLGKETLLNELRKELRVSSEEQRELLARVDSNTVIRGIRDWRQSGGHQPGMLVAGQSVHDPIPSQGAGPSSTLHPPSVSAANQPSSSLAKRGPMLEQKGKKHKSGQMDEPTFMGVDPNGGDDSVLLDVPGNLCTYRMEGQLINTPQSAPPQSVTPHQSAPPLLPQPAIQVPPAVASLFEQAVFQHIISKRLHHSDVVAGKARFSMPQNQILQQDFLCKSELDLLGKDELKIEVFISGDRFYEVDLKLYRSGKSHNRTKVLMGSAWRSLVNDLNLKVGDSVELWKGSKDGMTRYIITKV